MNIAGGGRIGYILHPTPTKSLYFIIIISFTSGSCAREMVSLRMLPSGPAGNELFR